MLAYRNDVARLMSLLAFTWVQGKTYFVTHCKVLKTATSDRVAMKVNFGTITCADESVILLSNKIRDLAMVRGDMRLDVSALMSGMVFKLSTHCIEAITHCDINVFMGMVFGWGALHHDFLAWNR